MQTYAHWPCKETVFGTRMEEMRRQAERNSGSAGSLDAPEDKMPAFPGGLIPTPSQGCLWVALLLYRTRKTAAHTTALRKRRDTVPRSHWFKASQSGSEHRIPEVRIGHVQQTIPRRRRLTNAATDARKSFLFTMRTDADREVYPGRTVHRIRASIHNTNKRRLT